LRPQPGAEGRIRQPRTPEAGASLAEREQLTLNPALARFLETPFPATPLATTEPCRFAWIDDRNALLFDAKGCTAEYIDPDVAPRQLTVDAMVDYAAIETLQARFGLPKDLLLPQQHYDHSKGHRDAWLRIRMRLSEACRERGVVWRDEIGLESGVVKPDYARLVAEALPYVRGVARAVLAQWRPIRNGPQYEDDVDALVSFVQRSIPYTTDWIEPDGNERFGLRTPGATLLYGGDCDSKSLLLATLLRATRPNLPLLLILLDTTDGPHSVLGVGIHPGTCATAVEFDGQIYTLVESTSGWGIGQVEEGFDVRRAFDWVVLP
jgi:hypothetical protein